VKILALETTERLATVAALEGNRLLAERELSPRQRSAQSLAPGIQALLREVGWRPRDVQLVALPVGPGSFTGLRVGATTAKMFAYAVGADVLGVNTLEVVAQRAPADVSALEIALDAQRRQVFAGRFVRDADGHLAWRTETHLEDESDWLARLAPPAAVSGPALRKLRDRVPEGVPVVDESLWTPTAAAAGRLASRHYQAGRRDPLWTLVPTYYRASAAEEKWRERNQ
jgi:tRNA threonylcarbamoyladenosine biosynthesis protein TsaB